MTWILRVCAPRALALIAVIASGCVNTDQDSVVPVIESVAEPRYESAAAVDWPAYGRTSDQQHFSPLKQINTGNVGRLSLAWSLELQSGNTNTQPIEVNGVLYFAMAYSVVHAVDAVTGKLLWKYDPEVYKTAGDRFRIGWGSRGIAWWNGKVYTVTHEGNAIAIDANTGKPLWSTPTLEKDTASYVTGAPRVFAGKLIIGNSGDNGAIRGQVTALDAETGEFAWRFWVVPGNPADGFEDKAMEMAAKTWAGEWWKYGGGGTPWNSFAFDEETDTVFVGTGNGYPFSHRLRSAGKGDNLFLASVVALDVNTGQYRWHYQTNPAEHWDYTTTQDLELTDLVIDGVLRRVLMTAPKNGFYYVIDRNTGELISAEPFVKVNWASSIDLDTGRPVEHPDARYEDKPFTAWPFSYGGHNWQPMAYSPLTGLTYIPTVEMGGTFTDTLAESNWNPPTEVPSGVAISFDADNDDPKENTGALVAWDPVKQRSVWRVEVPRMAPGGVIATAGGLGTDVAAL